MPPKAYKMQKAAKVKDAVTVAANHEAHARQAVSWHEHFTESRVLFLLLAVTVLVYANSLGGAFLYDDPKQIVGNSQLHSWSNILQAFGSDVWSFQRGTSTADVALPYYRPLFTVYLTLGYQLFGLWTPGWHLMNLLVHASATLMVYYLLRRLSGNWLIAALAATLFGLHPAHVESVSWISGIPDALAALCYVPALLWYARYREDGGKKWLASSAIAFAFSALCKESALSLPLVIAVWEMARAKSGLVLRLKNAALALTPYVIVTAGYLTVRLAVLGKLSWDHPMMARVPDTAIWMTVPAVVMSYLQHLIAPFYLSLIYGLPFVTSAADWRFVLPVALLVGLAAVLWFYRRRVTAEVWVACALLFAPLLPVLNLKVFHQENIVQDRYLYLPSIGFCFLAAWLIARLARQRTAATSLAVIMLVSFGASTVWQNRVWQNSTALWQRALVYAPQSWTAHYNLGLAYLQDKADEAARTQLLEAARLNPGLPIIQNNLALAESRLGDSNGAVISLNRALALDPNFVEARNNLGTILFSRGNYQAAREQFKQALEKDPASLPARFNLARATAATGDHGAAIREYETILAQTPDDAEARYQLALSYAAMGRQPEAMAQFERAINTERDTKRVAEMRAAIARLHNSH
jgi:tetratricopeptide (TPR) repeat protein